MLNGFRDNNRANKMLKEWLEKAKISKALTFHGLRHTFAMTAVARGIDIYALKELMGHASIESTLIYAKMFPSRSGPYSLMSSMTVLPANSPFETTDSFPGTPESSQISPIFF